MKLHFVFTIVLIVSGIGFTFAGDKDKKEKEPAVSYEFTDEIVLPATSVQNQYNTSTCWSFSGLSFLESEMLRLGKPEVNLSEMFVVWHSYSDKARKDVRVHGNLNFAPGGAFHDVTNTIAKYGIVPESVYSGIKNGETKHIHGEMDRVLKEEVDSIIENPGKRLSTAWHENIEATLDNYLGEIPNSFKYEGKTYTPQTFAAEYIGLNMNDYVEITSYTHHPFYSRFILEIPDNWSWDEVYNVPLEDFEEIIDNAIESGFTIAWAADVSEKGFVSANKGFAVLPSAPKNDMTKAEIRHWKALPEDEKEKELYSLEKLAPEIEVTQEMRQEAFDNYQTTDDHGMHIIGTAKNADGKEFYKVKNSWGDYNKYDGYFYTSKPYVAYKTMSIMVHKDAIPQKIREKLEL